MPGPNSKTVKVRDAFADVFGIERGERCEAITRDNGKTWDIRTQHGREIASGTEEEIGVRFKPVIKVERVAAIS